MAFDAIVIGSGFGGAVTACRLAEKGYRVCVLERGRRWDKKSFPREPHDPWVWNQGRPEKENGWIDFRCFESMSVVQGAAVGGGSLIYANVSCDAPPKTFERGWPKEITYAEMRPHYAAVKAFMGAGPVPPGQWTARTRLMKRAAEAIGAGDRFKPLDLAVSFDETWNYALENPHDHRHSREFTNPQGARQGTCVHLGHCDIGCPVLAKNTLDLNYLHLAETKHHADVRALHLVTDIRKDGEGYRVSFDRLDGGRRVPGHETARLVIVAAGSLGSTELLFRCRDETKSLPRVSAFLGRSWSSNGDFLTPALGTNDLVSPTRGPTISAAIDFLDGSRGGSEFWIEDGGFPNLVGAYLVRKASPYVRGAFARGLVDYMNALVSDPDPFKHVMPWFAQGVDFADGTLSLRRPFLFFGKKRLSLRWDIAKSKPVIDAIVAMHEKLARATGGVPLVPFTWTLSNDLVTPHPLGGCNMGESPENGVVDHKGEVFGHENLFVADGAIIPEAIGVNPSRTIGALAERIAKIIVDEGR